MESQEQAAPAKQKSFGTPLAVLAGAGVWWFLCSDPSLVALTVAGVGLLLMFLAFCVLALLLPEPNEEKKKETFVPLAQAEVNKPKSLSY